MRHETRASDDPALLHYNGVFFVVLLWTAVLLSRSYLTTSHLQYTEVASSYSRYVSRIGTGEKVNDRIHTRYYKELG